VDDKSLMADSTMEITQWQTCGSQVVDDKSLIANSTMEITQLQTCGSQVVEGNGKPVVHKLWMTSR
jgi:hypothetical protein